MTRRVMAALASAALLAGCSQTTAGHGTRFDPEHCGGGTLTVLNSREIPSFDPARLYATGGGNIPGLLFRSLTTRRHAPGAEGAAVVPDLATDTGTSSDGDRTWTFHLRPGIFFEDGTPITSADVKYGVERGFAAELTGGPAHLHDWLVGGTSYRGPYEDPAGLAAVETPDPSTVVFRLRVPVSSFPYFATATQFVPVPRAKDTRTAYSSRPVASGPYRFDTYEPNNRLVLVRNPHWSREVDAQRLACPDRIDIRFGIDPATINQRLITSANGDADAVTGDTQLQPSDIARVSADPQVGDRITRGQLPAVWFVGLNTTGPLADVRVRRAISYAVNRQAVVNAVGGAALASPATTVLPPLASLGHRAYDHYPAGPTGDLAAAERLLAEAGLPEGFTVSLLHATGPDAVVAAAIQDALGRARIRVTLKSVDPRAYSVEARKQADMFLTLQHAEVPVAQSIMQPLFDGRRPTSVLSDREVEARIDELSSHSDPAKAAAGWGELDEQLGERALVVPLYHIKSPRLFGRNVKNAYPSDWIGVYDLSVLSVR